MSTKTTVEARAKRRRRIRAKVTGSAGRPRVSVFRSNRAIYAQLIDDTTGTTLAAARSSEVDAGGLDKSGVAKKVGVLLAERARARNIDSWFHRPTCCPKLLRRAMRRAMRTF